MADKAAGYDLTTPMIVTNTEEYTSVEMLRTGAVNFDDAIVEVSM